MDPLTQVPILFVERYVIKSILFSSCNAIMGFLKMDSPEGATGLNKNFKNKVGFLKMAAPEGATSAGEKLLYYPLLYNIISYYSYYSLIFFLLFPMISL